MQNLKIGRYTHPETQASWLGWIEPDDMSWIMFIDADNRPTVFLDRDPRHRSRPLAVRGMRPDHFDTAPFLVVVCAT